MLSYFFKKIKEIFIFLVIFITGAAVLVIEILGTRLLAPFYGSTIFVWSSLIVVTLSALSLGYFAGGYIADRYPKKDIFYGFVFCAGFLTLLIVCASEFALVFSDQFGFQWGPMVATIMLFAIPLFFFGIVTPFVVRLLSVSVEHTGHIAGKVFALATVGSVFGAVATGFYLAPRFSFTTIFIGIATIVMVAAITGMILEKTKLKIIAFFILLFLIASAVFFSFFDKKQDDGTTILYQKQSFYGDIRVVTVTGDLICMMVDAQGQSCVYRDGRQAFAYGNMIKDILSNTDEGQRQSALIIGLGGGVIARDLKKNSGIFENIDVVEIDEKMIEPAKIFFGYDDTNSGINTIIADGRRFLRKNNKQYDAIVLDAFSGGKPTPHLYTKEAFLEIKKSLSSDGILVINTTGYVYGEKAILSKALAKTFKNVFDDEYDTYILSTADTEGDDDAFDNLLFIASKKELALPYEKGFFARYDDDEMKNAPLLTDSRNAIDILGIPVFKKARDNYKMFLLSTAI